MNGAMLLAVCSSSAVSVSEGMNFVAVPSAEMGRYAFMMVE